MGLAVLLSLNTYKLFEAAASLQGPSQALPQEEILIEETGEESPSGSPSSLQSKASGSGRCKGDSNIPKSGLYLPDPWSGALQQGFRRWDGSCALVPSGLPIASTSAPAVTNHGCHHLLPSGSIWMCL